MSFVDSFRASPSAALFSLVRSSYGLDCDGARDLGGGYNLNLLVAGSFVVRVYGSWVSASRLAGVQAVREGLRAAGWPLAPLHLALSGAGFVAFGDRLVEVEAYVSAGSPMTSWPDLSAGLPWLARLHAALRSCSYPPAAAAAPVANHLPAGLVREETAPAFAALRSWVSTDAERRYLDVAERLASVVASVDRFDVPSQLVHGDFWHHNVMLSGSRLVRLGDFDFLGTRPRVDDLALTLFFANEQHGRDDLSPARIDQLRRLVAAYDAEADHPLSAVERAALPYAIARTPLTFVRDLVDGSPFHRQELVDLRGPEWEWSLHALDNPHWLTLA